MPDPRHRGRQQYRSTPECKQAEIQPVKVAGQSLSNVIAVASMGNNPLASRGCKLKSPSAKKPKHVFQ